MRKFKSLIVCLLLLASVSSHAQASAPKPYIEGPLWQVQFAKSKPGMGKLYLKNLSEGWAKVMKQAKEEGVIMDYKLISSVPANKEDWSLMFMYEVKNYAALDGIDDKMEAINNKIMGNEEAQQKAAISRNDLREIFGAKLCRELVFK